MCMILLLHVRKATSVYSSYIVNVSTVLVQLTVLCVGCCVNGAMLLIAPYHILSFLIIMWI